ncbi:family 35 putative beta-galactosidase glycoside hydrolase [Bisporella sp. PMI_857]|nr:family 35 putative beta-galactosidase glycoside hydrolase [Bisporella sp. PMI_857]
MPATSCNLPYLEKLESSWQLWVDGRPFLMLGAELQNSSMSSANYMNGIWKNLVDMGINTVLGPVAWEDIEPEEGKFDFSVVTAIIASARTYGLRLILLWFGSFKNGMSTYTPDWVKTDAKRFPRMLLQKDCGKLVNSGVLSIFHTECLDADLKAFTKLMAYLETADKDRTVIMVQVQNEVGLLGDSRDRSKTADGLFEAPVPEEIVKFIADDWDNLLPDLQNNFSRVLKNIQKYASSPGTPSWKALFGDSAATDELFMAYHYALYLEKIAAAGRKKYNIPLFTNVWQKKPSTDAVAGGGGTPGVYPSGGGVPEVLDIWQKFAPSLDCIAPDIYLNDYSTTLAKYRHHGQPLIIPEQRRDEYGARRIWEAFGTYQALLASPFGIDTLKAVDSPFTSHYKLLDSVSYFVLRAQRDPSSMVGFFFDELEADGSDLTPPRVAYLGDYELRISRAFVFGKPGPGAGIIFQLEPGRFLLVGCGFKVEFKATSTRSVFTGILRFDEKSVVDKATGTLRTERRLNGDETRSGAWANMPNEKPDPGQIPIPITIPARTMIAEVTVFSLEEEE